MRTLTSQDLKKNTTTGRLMFWCSSHIVADTSVKVGSSRRSGKWLTGPKGFFYAHVKERQHSSEPVFSELLSSYRLNLSSYQPKAELLFETRQVEWNQSPSLALKLIISHICDVTPLGQKQKKKTWFSRRSEIYEGISLGVPMGAAVTH